MFSKTYYEILNIETTADQDQIKIAWRKKAMELHSGRDTTEKMQEVNHGAEVVCKSRLFSEPTQVLRMSP